MSPNRVLLIDLVLVAGLAAAAYIGVRAALRLRRGERPRSHSLLLMAAADLTLLGIVMLYGADLVEVGGYPDQPAVVLVVAFIAATGIAVAVADTVLHRVPKIVGRGWPEVVTTALALAVGFGAVVVVVDEIEADPMATTLLATDATVSAIGAGTIDERYALPAGPLDIAMDGPRSGYVSVHPGEILHFRLPDDPGAELVLETVATGLAFPRGLALADGTLFAALVGPTVCPDPANLACRPELSSLDRELETIAGSAASIVAFPVNADGTLGPPATILSDLPVTAFDHAVNALEAGPDGRLYASIGSYSDLSLRPDLAAAIDHPNRDLLGTVISFQPDGSDLQVHARGFRNSYDLAFSRNGELYTADNDGEALNSIRREELLRIEPGGHYGWPDDGTFAPFTTRTHFPAWILDQVGSSGVAWAVFGDAEGLVVGALSSVRFAEFGTRDGAAGRLIGSPGSVRRLIGVDGYATTVDQLPDGRLLLGVFSPWAPEKHGLLVLSVEL